MFKQMNKKLFFLAPIIVAAVILVFTLTMFPSAKAQPRNLPIAIVNQDQGVEIPNQPKMNMGQNMLEMIGKTATSTDEEPAVKWIIVNSIEEVKAGLNQREYYAALIIPQDFSAKQASLRTTTPTSPEVETLINQGMNPTAATAAGQILNGMIDNMNKTIRTQLQDGFVSQGVSLTVEQANSLVTPIIQKVTNVNAIGTKSMNGNAPVSLFQPMWMASMISAAVLFMAFSKQVASSRRQALVTKLVQMGMGILISAVVGFGLTWLAQDMLGLDIPYFAATATFLMITCLSFYLMISAVLSWIGFGGIPLFALVLFFSAPLLSLPPEMMTSFYRNGIYSWLPMRFMVDGLRELFFFGQGLQWNTALATLTWIAVGSALVILSSAFKGSKVSKEAVPSVVTSN